jgi:hypothetical protein
MLWERRTSTTDEAKTSAGVLIHCQCFSPIHLHPLSIRSVTKTCRTRVRQSESVSSTHPAGKIDARPKDLNSSPGFFRPQSYASANVCICPLALDAFTQVKLGMHGLPCVCQHIAGDRKRENSPYLLLVTAEA